jgi:hypothetical protein
LRAGRWSERRSHIARELDLAHRESFALWSSRRLATRVMNVPSPTFVKSNRRTPWGVGCDLVVHDQAPDVGHGKRGRTAGVGTGHNSLEHTRLGEVIDAANAVHITGRDRMQHSEIAGTALGGEARSERGEDLVRAT